MCGFYTEFFSEKRYSSNLNILKKSILKHRGPDQKEVIKLNNFKLYFWRLAIVDNQLGKQPMFDDEKNLIILFNGEIYNYLKLRQETKQIHTYKTNSDTEVIIGSYKKWGLKCFDKFEGMFSILIIDLKKNNLIMARDICGVKPLYFFFSNNCLKVASESKAFLIDKNIDFKIDKFSLKKFILYQSVDNHRTLIKDVKKLLPGEVKIFDLKNLNKIKNFFIKLKSFDNFETYNSYSSNLKENILENVKLSTESPLVAAFHLSGGIDSNLLISITKKIFPEKKIFTYSSLIEGVKDPEYKYIESARKIYKSKHTYSILNKKNFFNLYNKALYYLDEPVGDPGVVAQFLVNKEIAKKFKIVISGQGSDEMFMGYMRNYLCYLNLKYDLRIEKKKKKLNQISIFLKGWENFISKNIYKSDIKLNFYKNLKRIDYVKDKIFSNLKLNLNKQFYNDFNVLDKERDILKFMVLSETKIQLPSLLHMEDRASMAYSLETRVPLCTNSVLGLSLKSELDWTFRENLPKGVLRDVFKEYLPKMILNRKKKVGRPVPFKKWLFENKNELINFQKNEELVNHIFKKNIFNYLIENKNAYDRTLWGVWSLVKFINQNKIIV